MTTIDVHSRYASRARCHRRNGGLPLPPLIALGALALVAVCYIAAVLWPRWPSQEAAPAAPTLPITVAGIAFNVPPEAIRVPIQRRSGAQERVDLDFMWPSLEPPDPTSKPTLIKKGMPTPQPIGRIFITIAVAGSTLAPADRVNIIYPRYASKVPVAGPDGLAILAFRDGTPYQGEDLIYDGATPDNFLVRCSRNGPGPTPGICLYDRRIGAADVTVRFPRDWLEDWRNVAAGIERLIAKLRARG
jgi:hypothetical protein